ncbi:MAG: AbrB/MazE/SpoVT family DNA-binding domain-containing protein [Chloroflexi bacterium]|nr:AbrB/MazE/SpoVT family DNA-binding domain-containing protein [Chloroflexota bacterium]
MSIGITTRVVKIGNSRGIRIPKPLLDRLGPAEEVELIVEGDQLIVRPIRRPRDGWDEQFELMAQRGDDRLLDGAASLTGWDAEEWEW